MARQKGIIKLKGSIGDVSFYKSKNGYLAREKGGVDAERIKNDPAYQRTRENGSEFGRAGRAGRVIRTAFRPLLIRTADGRMTSRLTKQLIRVLHQDSTNTRGERKVEKGNLKLLQNFEFNVEGKLNSTFYANYEVSVNRSTGTAVIDIGEYIPKERLMFPQGATHMKLLAAIGEIDFESETSIFSSAESEEVEIGTDTVAASQLSMNFTANSEKTILLAFGIEFFQNVNDQLYAIKNGSYNCLSLVFVEGPVPPQMN